MKILIVSFDRKLTEQLKKALENYEVIDVKNGEEALNLAVRYFDVVIYDAISGAISEEDINNIYEQRFKDAKFIVLIDDLFPINEKNLKPHKKLFIRREEAAKEILNAIEKPLEEDIELPQPLLPELEIEEFSLTPKEPQEISQAFYPKEIYEEESPPPLLEQPSEQEKSIPPGRKIAIVSFDSTLIDSLTSLLTKDVKVSPIKSFRNLEDALKDQDLVVFDAISGLIAKKRLMELSKDPIISSKPFIILIDDLFSIDVEDIPLAIKHTIPREDGPQKIYEKIMEILTLEEVKPVASEGISSMQILEKLIQEKESQEQLEKISEEEAIEVEEGFPFSPTEEVLPHVEEISLTQERKEELPTVPSQVIIPDEKIEKAIYQAIKDLGPIDQIFKNALKESIMLEQNLDVVLREELKMAISSVLQENVIKEVIYQVVKETVKEMINSIPLERIIKETTYEALKERLRELIT